MLGYLLLRYEVSLDEEIGDLTDYRKGNFATAFLEPKIGVRVQKIV